MTQALIVGGGPVGLYLALVLHAEGIDVSVFERDASPRRGSRSIGVHPPAIELWDELGLANELIACGVRVRRGRAFGEAGELGSIEFDDCPPPHRYVLAVPQHETERILRDALVARSPGALELGTVVGVVPCRDDVAVRLLRPDGRELVRRGAVLIACDGRRSAVRNLRGIQFDGATYPGGYAMADFPDETALGDDAAIYLDRSGLVESFPLPGRIRRWVVRLGEGTLAEVPTDVEVAGAIAARVASRCEERLDVERVSRPSTFRAERRVARRFAQGRIALAGDAAHVVSPIGGQGMNLGWLGARALASDLASALRKGAPIEPVLATNARRRERLARAAARRAELNMWLGRPVARPWARDAALRTVLRSPLVGLLGRVFTMRGLALGV
jgi:2-polyprenyl-6-methoxyphenol hydroxylase-like FAD-dependent oxidoreductase